MRSIPSPAMRDGVLRYICADPASCPGRSVTGISGTSYTVQPGNEALSPLDIKGLDPWFAQGINPAQAGPNLVMLNYFQKTYAGLSGNDVSVGDGLNYVGFRFRATASFDNNAFIARLDYHLTADARHTLFWHYLHLRRFRDERGH